MSDENERLVRAFYTSTAPGHREALRGIQSPHVVYDIPRGMPVGCGHFEGLENITNGFLANFYGAFDVRFIAEEFLPAGEHVTAIGKIQGKTRGTGVPIEVPFVHVWTVTGGYLQQLRAFTDTAILVRALEQSGTNPNP